MLTVKQSFSGLYDVVIQASDSSRTLYASHRGSVDVFSLGDGLLTRRSTIYVTSEEVEVKIELLAGFQSRLFAKNRRDPRQVLVFNSVTGECERTFRLPNDFATFDNSCVGMTRRELFLLLES